MNTMFAAVLALVLSLAVFSHASLLPHPARQLTTLSGVIGNESEVIGSFNLLASQSGRKCPRKIEHTDVAVPQPHANIKMNNNQCDGDGSMTLLGKDSDGDVSAVIDAASEKLSGEAKAIVESLRAISESIGLLVIGLEEEGRDCGRFLPDKLDSNTVVVILRTTSDTEIEASRLRLDFRYMIVSSPSGQYCLYTSKTIVPPSPTPTSSMVVESTMAPEPATTVPPTSETDTTTTETDTTPTETDTTTSETDTTTTETGGTILGTEDGEDMDDEDDDPMETPSSAEEVGKDGDMKEDGQDHSDHDEDNGQFVVTPAPDASGEPGDDDVCFPADATVTLESGAVKRMDAVQLGDRIHVGNGEFSDVFMFSHKVSDITYKFVTLSTLAGRTLSATKGHYIYLNGKLSAARYAKVGDVVIAGDGSEDSVSSVTMDDVKRGLFNPQTAHGDIVVNDVRATTFTTTVQHCAAHAMMAPLRWVYNVVGLTLNVLENGGGKAVSYVPGGQGMVSA